LRVEFKNSKGQKLVGLLDKPSGEGPFPAVVVCHGFTGVKDEQLHAVLAKTLADNGFIAFRFDFTGNGESEGEFSDGTVEQETMDIESAVEFLGGQDFVDVDRLFVTGHSMGAIVAFNYCDHHKVNACAAIAPGVLFKPYAEQRFKDYMGELEEKGQFVYHKDHYDGRVGDYVINQDFLESFKAIDVFDMASKANTPVIVVQGTNDNTAAKKPAIDKLFDALKEPKELKWVQGADHCFRKTEHSQEMSQAVVEFFQVNL